ncbi:hypothetical protein OIU84_014583 [Salix udensis]|uniref:Uncharacterized protein n=1 Tax=Salix udensis TaxID=889485 RepID=A0AAD6JEB8_9ROSI|nr:hypothetical protein OIU84_014583 [Salix udensis]
MGSTFSNGRSSFSYQLGHWAHLASYSIGPSLMSIKETRSAVLDVAGTFSDRPLFFGGPLEEGLFLVSPQRGYDNDTVAKSGVFEEVMRGVYYGTRESAGCAAEMARRNVVGLGDFRFFRWILWVGERAIERRNTGRLLDFSSL